MRPVPFWSAGEGAVGGKSDCSASHDAGGDRKGLSDRVCDKEVSQSAESVVGKITGGRAHGPLHI